jgi:hypothetical protein
VVGGRGGHGYGGDVMAMDDRVLAQLRELLKTCSADIVGVGGSRGTGFFVDDGLLLTCAHVIKGSPGDEVQVRPFGRSVRQGWIHDVRPGNDLDLALVDVAPGEGEDPQPAVALDDRLNDATKYYAVGYPKEGLLGATGLEEIPYQGHRKYGDHGTVDLLVLEAGGALIGSGLSGGPILSTETGAVAALVQYAQDTEKDSGGAAIPIERAAREFKEIQALILDPPVATRRWRDALGRQAWEALGKKWGWRRSHDIVLAGTRHAWKVRVDSEDGLSEQLTVRNLPDEVAEALFEWAQRRRPRRDEEVKLLGRLLAAAVFPDAIAAHIWRERQVDELRVRLRVEGDSDLFDIPWEFVTVQTQSGDKFSSSEKGLGLVRIAPHADPDSVDRRPAPGEAGVLAAVIQPTEWQSRMPRFTSPGKTVAWPKENVILSQLRDSVKSSSGFRFLSDNGEPLANPTKGRFEEALQMCRERGAPPEIVHYIGFGHVGSDGAKLAFSDDEGDVDWADVSDFLEMVADSGARVLVVEFALPPFDLELEPVSPRGFLPALANRLNAVVFTRFPVHPRQFKTFNTALYDELGNGHSIETAVQTARWRLYRTPSLDDVAAFGWFTLVTGPGADMRILPLREGLIEGGPKQPAAVQSAPVQAKPDDRYETFSREG